MSYSANTYAWPSSGTFKGLTAVRLASMSLHWTSPHMQHTAVAGLATVTLSKTR